MSTDNYSHTCITCRVAFARAELQRDHYKSDWHRYNLKRKVAELPAVSAETFQQKVTEMKISTATPDVESLRCLPCNKTFQSSAAYENHCKSNKHLDLLAKSSSSPEENVKHNVLKRISIESKDVAEMDVGVNDVKDSEESKENSSEEWEGEGLGIEECLFCPTTGSNLDENLKHMSLSHGFYIPDLEYCTDVEGLLTYLGEKVGCGNLCLWCNEKGRSFRSLDAVQKHMRDKCHCKLCHDGEAMLEYSDYYDYSSSYPDAGNVGEEEADNEVDLPVLEERDWQLVLPSGTTIGHRSLLRYYKQRLRPENQISLLAKKQTVSRLLNQYRALGWTGTSGVDAQRKARDLKYMKKLHAKHQMQLGVKANKLQTHFRPQVNF